MVDESVDRIGQMLLDTMGIPPELFRSCLLGSTLRLFRDAGGYGEAHTAALVSHWWATHPATGTAPAEAAPAGGPSEALNPADACLDHLASLLVEAARDGSEAAAGRSYAKACQVLAGYVSSEVHRRLTEARKQLSSKARPS